jgi:hypothetical protein
MVFCLYFNKIVLLEMGVCYLIYSSIIYKWLLVNCLFFLELSLLDSL